MRHLATTADRHFSDHVTPTEEHLLKLEEKSLKAKKALKRLKPMKSNAAHSLTDSLRRC